MDMEIRDKFRHILGVNQKAYFHDLAFTAQVENVRDVIWNIFVDLLQSYSSSNDFRRNKYIIIDDKNFNKVREWETILMKKDSKMNYVINAKVKKKLNYISVTSVFNLLKVKKNPNLYESIQSLW